LKLYNLKDYQYPTTFTITPSKDQARNIMFLKEVPEFLQNWKIKIVSINHIARLQYLLMVRRNKFKVDLWFDGPKARDRRLGFKGRYHSAWNEGILKLQPIFKDYK
jgi:hypothetical protein